MGIKVYLKKAGRFILPIGFRKHAAVWIDRQRWLSDHLSMGIVRDLQTSDSKAFHKFLWSHHIGGYAKWYDSVTLFDVVKMNGSTRTRSEFFNALVTAIKDLGLDPARDIRSVLEVGCSLGYLLRYMELELFPDAEDFVGLDIDGPAIEKGSRYLANAGSKVRLIQGDMEELNRLLGKHTFDFIFATGVLSYLNAIDAAKVVSEMLRRTNKILALLGLACTSTDNNELPQSLMSNKHNNQWLHNFKSMIEAGGGRVIISRWEGAKQLKTQAIYFVFAVP
jgi:SAM-dependent methyltransferase